MKSAPESSANTSARSGPAPALAAFADALATWRKTEGLRWLFVFKITTIAFVTLWLAYRLALDSPSTAVTTAFIVALPTSGAVLEKALFRIIGTLVGCTMAVIMVGLLPQAAPLLFICLAIWVGLCTAGAAIFRNSKSYGFLLAGYTACMIAIPAIDLPTQVFTLAITRVTEVSLGILCSAFISDALFPRHQGDQVLQAVKGRYENFIGLCRDTLQRKLTPAEVELAHLRFAADVATLETSRSAAFFEATHTYSESRNLHLFNTAFMAALTTFYTLHRLLHRMRANSSKAVCELTEALGAIFLSALDENAEAGTAQATRMHIRERAERLRKEMIPGETSNAERINLDTIIDLLERFAQNVYDFQVVYFALMQKKRLPYSAFHSYAPRTPFPIVFASGLRTVIATLILASLWYFLAWQFAGLAMLMTVVFTALAASSPHPTKLIFQIVTGFLIGVPAAFICNFFVGVHAEGFVMLALSIAPFIMLGTYISSIPKTAGIGLGMNLFLTQTIFPENATRIDPTIFLNNAIALVVGGALAWVVYVTVLPGHTVGEKNYIAAALRREALRTCTSYRPESPQRFDHRIRDLLNQLNAAAGPAPDAETRAVLSQALTMLELGHAVISMRELILVSPSSEVQAGLQKCIDGIATALRAPTQRHLQDVMDAILVSGQLVRSAKLNAAPERVVRLNMALADLHSLYTLVLDHEQLRQVPAQMPNKGEPLVA